MSNAPFLTTDRLTLHKPEIGDVWPLFDIVSHPVTGRFLGSANGRADHFTRFQRNAGSWLLHGYGSFVVRLRGEQAQIGNCGVFHSFRGLGADFDDRPEAGWILAAEHMGKGYGAEAMRAALAWFEREHGCRRIVAMIAEGNRASMALAARLGFAPMRDAELADGETVRLFERLP